MQIINDLLASGKHTTLHYVKKVPDPVEIPSMLQWTYHDLP